MNLKRGFILFVLVISIGFLSASDEFISGLSENVPSNFVNSDNFSNFSGVYTTSSTPETDSYGYIIVLKDKPMAVVSKEVNDLASENQKKIDSMSVFNPLKYAYSTFATTPEDVPEKLQDARENIEDKQEKLKEAISDKLDKNLKDSSGTITGNAVSEEDSSDIDVLMESSGVLNAIALDISAEEAQRISNLRDVQGVYLNRKVELTLSSAVPFIQSNILSGKLDIDGNDCTISKKTCLTGEGIKVAVMDTGVDYTHPDFGACTSEQFLAGSCARIPGGYDFSDRDNNPMDYLGHGTHCAGIIGANGAIRGVAPNVKIYALKVFPNAYPTVLINALNYVLDPNGDKDFSDHLDVVSMSFGTDCKKFFGTYGPYCGPNDELSLALDNLALNGIVPVVAAGNSGPDEFTVGSPGTSRRAITVGAFSLTSPLKPASFSSRGAVSLSETVNLKNFLVKPEILAPGVDICSSQWGSYHDELSCLDTNHIAISGTSMATPMVAGAVAILKQAHPDWSVDQIKNQLKMTSNTYPTLERTYGNINLKNALLTRLLSPVKISDVLLENNQLKIYADIPSTNFFNYKVILQKKDTLESFTTLCNSNTYLTGLICSFDVSSFEGDYLIEVSITDTFGKTSIDRRFIEINNLYFNNLKEGDFIIRNQKIGVKIDVPISGYRVFYKKYGSNDYINLISSEGSTNYFEFDLGSLNFDSSLFLKVSVNINGNWVDDKPISINYFWNLLWKKNFDKPFSNSVTDFNLPIFYEESGKNELILSFDNSIKKLSSSGDINSITSISGEAISTYKTNSVGIISFSGPFFSIYLNNNKYGLVDNNFNFYSKWPTTLLSHPDNSLVKYWPLKTFIYKYKVINLLNMYGFTLGESGKLYDFNKVIISDLSGNELVSFPDNWYTSTSNSLISIIYDSIFLSDLEKDNDAEILHLDLNPNFYDKRSYLKKYSLNGELLANILLNDPNAFIAASIKLAIADINNDNLDEIILLYSKMTLSGDGYLSIYPSLVILNRNLEKILDTSIPLPYLNYLSIGDNNGDNIPEVFLYGNYNSFLSYSFSDGFKTYSTVGQIRKLNIADIDSDNINEVLSLSLTQDNYEVLRIFKGNNLIQESSFKTRFGMEPIEFIVNDFNSNGKTDFLIFNSHTFDKTTEILFFELDSNLGKVDWGMTGHDNMRSYNFNCDISSCNLPPFIYDPIVSQINFTLPTPSNESSTTAKSIDINVSISEENLKKLVYNWNNINYSLYDDNLIFMSNLDENSLVGDSSSVLADISSNKNNGVLTSPAYAYSNKFNIYLNFGLDKKLSLSNLVPFFKHDFTLSFWVYPTYSIYQNAIYSYISGNSCSTSNGCGMSMLYYPRNADRDALFQFLLYSSSSSSVLYFSPSLLPSGKWTQVTYTLNNTDDLSLYINGKLETFSSTKLSGNIDFSGITGNDKLVFGKAESANFNTFNGGLDELRIWNVSLDAALVEQNYYSVLTKKNLTDWILYVNQSKLPDGLDLGKYNYSAYVYDVNNNFNKTELREINVEGLSFSEIVPSFSSQHSYTENSPDYSINLNIRNTNANAGVFLYRTPEYIGDSLFIKNFSAIRDGTTDKYSINLGQLSAGNYTYYFWAYNSDGSSLTKTSNYSLNISKRDDFNVLISSDPLSPSTTTSVKITCSLDKEIPLIRTFFNVDDTLGIIEEDYSGVLSGTTISLPINPEGWKITCYSTFSSNYSTKMSEILNYIVQPSGEYMELEPPQKDPEGNDLPLEEDEQEFRQRFNKDRNNILSLEEFNDFKNNFLNSGIFSDDRRSILFTAKYLQKWSTRRV